MAWEGTEGLSKHSSKAHGTPHTYLLQGLRQASSILPVLQQALLLLQEVLGDVSLGRVVVLGLHALLEALQKSCVHWVEGLERDGGSALSSYKRDERGGH